MAKRSIANRTARSRNSGEYGFEVRFFDVCSITGNSPRVLPSGKPGAVQSYGRSTPYAAERDSTKVTHSLRGSWGELYRYLGLDFWIGGKTRRKIAMVTLIMSRLLVARLGFDYIGLFIMLDINLLSYFLDGCATFGSRIWVTVLPAIALAWCLRHRHARRIPRNRALWVVT